VQRNRGQGKQRGGGRHQDTLTPSPKNEVEGSQKWSEAGPAD